MVRRKLYSGDQLNDGSDGLRPDEVVYQYTLRFYKKFPFTNYHPLGFVVSKMI